MTLMSPVDYGTIMGYLKFHNREEMQMNKDIELLLTDEDLIILDEALSQLPYFKVVGLINKINQQIQGQDNNSVEQIDNQ